MNKRKNFIFKEQDGKRFSKILEVLHGFLSMNVHITIFFDGIYQQLFGLKNLGPGTNKEPAKSLDMDQINSDTKDCCIQWCANLAEISISDPDADSGSRSSSYKITFFFNICGKISLTYFIRL